MEKIIYNLVFNRKKSLNKKGMALVQIEAYLNRKKKYFSTKVYLKPENMQYTGAYKLRGAYYKISTLSEEDRAKGLITASAGNHAQGVAYAARERGAKATICMPQITPQLKVDATKAYGADVVLCGEVFDEAAAHAQELSDNEGMIYVPPFDDYEVLCGQGTIGLELLEQLPDVDNVIVPIGGGGLISGVAYAIKSLNPSVKVYGVQASGAPSMVQSFEKHHIECLPSVSTIADGIAVKEPGEHTFDLCEKYVDGIVTVSEDEICAAILALMEQQKLIAEGAGAVSVAAAMFNKVPVEGKKTICLVSGGNIDVTILSRVINRGLTKSGRNCVLTLELIDKPGQLMRVAQVIAQHGANILSSHHERNGENANVNACTLRVVMETRNAEHVEEIRKALLADGFHILD